MGAWVTYLATQLGPQSYREQRRSIAAPGPPSHRCVLPEKLIFICRWSREPCAKPAASDRTDRNPLEFVVTESKKIFCHQPLRLTRRTGIAILLLLAFVQVLAGQTVAGQTVDDWQVRVRSDVRNHHLDDALAVVEQRLANAPEDLEAHGWHGRLLAWKGRWSEGENEFKLVLDKFPDDSEILTALADVLLWQHNYAEALVMLDRARKISPSDPEILSRRARVLALLGRSPEARSQYQQTLQFDSQNQDARTGLASLSENTKQELRLGEDVDFFNFANTAQHPTARDWFTVGSAVANSQNVVPVSEALFEYGHAFRIENRWFRGLESSYQQHWFWYHGAHVLALNTSQIVYLPHEWTWSLNVTGARTGFVGTPVAWTPSGWT